MFLPCSTFWRSDARGLTAARLSVRRREKLGRSARSWSARGFRPSLLLLLLTALPLLSPTHAYAAAEKPAGRVLPIASYDLNRPAAMLFSAALPEETGLSERELQPGSVVLFGEPTFWEFYRWYIVGIAAACVIEALLIALLLLVQRRRKRAERERLATLVESEHRHVNEVVSNVPGIVWETLIDPETNTRRPTFISDYVEKMLGYTPEEWLSAAPGFGLRIMPEEEDRERLARVSEEVMETGRDAVAQFRWRAKNGSLLWVETHLCPMTDEAGKVVGLRGVSLDITGKKLAEVSRSQVEQRDRAILQAIPDLMFLQTRDGVYLDFHAKDTKDLLVPPKEFIGKSVRDVMPPKLAERFLECFRLARETAEPQLVEYELTLEGGVRWYEARIVGCGENVLSVVRDITERVKNQEAIRESEKRYRATFEQAAVGVAHLSLEGRWLRVNQKLCDITGYTREELLAKTFRDITHPEDLDANLAHQRRLLAGEDDTLSMEKRYVRKDGSLVWVDLTGSLLRDEATAEPLYFVSIVEDISERKRAEAQLLDLKDELAAELKSMNRLHELSTRLLSASELQPLLEEVLDATIALLGADFGNVQLFEPATGTLNVAAQRGFQQEFLDYFANVEGGAGCCGTALLRRERVISEDVQTDPIFEPHRRIMEAACVRAVQSTPLFSHGGKPLGVISTHFREPHRPSEWELRLTDLYARQVAQMIERKRAEEALRESEEKYRTLFETIDEGFTVFDIIYDDEGRAVDLFFRVTNPAFERQTGWGNAVGKRVRELAPDLEEYWFENYARVIATGEPTRFTNRAAPLGRWYEVYAFRLGDAGSRTVAVLFSDVSERIRAEEASKRSEAVLAQAGKMASLGAWEVDLSHSDDINENPLVWSDEVYRIYGYEPGSVEVSSEFFFRHVHPEDRQRIHEAIQAAFDERRPYKEEHRIVRADGSEGVVQELAAFDVDEAGRPRRIIGAVQDITERKAAEEAHRRSEAVLEQAGKMASFGAWEVDLSNTKDINRNSVIWSDEVYRIYGYEPGSVEVSTDLFYRHVHPDDRRRVEETYRAAVYEGKPYNLEHRIVRADCAERVVQAHAVLDVDGAGRPRRITGAIQDITERKAADEALRQSEERFRNMADTAPVMIWVAGTDKLCNYFNKQWLDFTGRSIDEELGIGWIDGVHPEDHARCLETYTSSFDRREPFKMEYRVRRADGVFRWVYDAGTPRFSSAGEFLGYIGSCVDITDRKESEETLQSVMDEVNRLKDQLQAENIYLQEEIKLEHNFSEIVGRGDAIKYVLHKIEQVAPTDSTVLITGETGTGKELVAHAIHGESLRRGRPLVKVNCAALSASLIESELFGHERGAFTGATGRKIGRFELADGATLFLDEIGELPTELQAKLLRVIQEGEFERLGSNKTIKVNVRIIAATNRDLWKAVQQGLFREDLWYRLNVFPITMPPLRQRMEDIPLLAEHFVNSFSKKMGKKITSVTPATINALRNYSWPGNVRELANVVERAVINNGGPVLRISNLSEGVLAETQPTQKKTLEEMEREYIINILESTGWRIEGRHGAARLLGLNPSTLRTRMAKLKVHKPQASHA